LDISTINLFINNILLKKLKTKNKYLNNNFNFFLNSISLGKSSYFNNLEIRYKKYTHYSNLNKFKFLNIINKVFNNSLSGFLYLNKEKSIYNFMLSDIVKISSEFKDKFKIKDKVSYKKFLTITKLDYNFLNVNCNFKKLFNIKNKTNYKKLKYIYIDDTT
jgi:hypothetical protein